jgi:hypothetical protein
MTQNGGANRALCADRTGGAGHAPDAIALPSNDTHTTNGGDVHVEQAVGHYAYSAARRHRHGGDAGRGPGNHGTSLLSNGSLVTATPRTVISWDTLTWKFNEGGTGELTCHFSLAGTVSNPEGGGAGEGSTQVFVPYDCEKIPCAADGLGEPQWKGEGLPWPSKLESIGLHEARSTTKGMKIAVGCEEAPGTEKFIPLARFFGSLKPLYKNGGGKASNPGFVEFAKGSGELEQDPPGSGIRFGTEGKLKVLGYANEEVIGTCDVTTAEGAPSVCL